MIFRRRKGWSSAPKIVHMPDAWYLVKMPVRLVSTGIVNWSACMWLIQHGDLKVMGFLHGTSGSVF